MKIKRKLIVAKSKIDGPAKTNLPPEKYAPVDCEFTDELESLITHRLKVIVNHIDQDGHITTTEPVRLEKLIHQNGAEYVILGEQVKIRFDHIVEIKILPMEGD